MLDHLRKNEIVKKARYNYHGILVTFATGITEKWLFAPVPTKRNYVHMLPKSGFLKRKIKTYCEFESVLFDEDRERIIWPHFIIQYSDIAKAGFADVRIKVHELIYRLVNEGWSDFTYPPEALEEDKRRLYTAKYVPHYRTGLLKLTAAGINGGYPGRIIATQFVGYGDQPLMQGWWKNPKVLVRAINKIIEVKGNITRSNIIRYMYKEGMYYSPTYFRAILERILEINKAVILDTRPNYGELAMASMVNNGVYYYKPIQPFHDHAPKLAEYLQFGIAPDDGSSVDIVMYSSRKRLSVDEAIDYVAQYKHRADTILFYIEEKDIDEINRILSPRRMIETKLFNNKLRQRLVIC